MSSIRRIRQEIDERDKYLEGWVNDVRESRIVVRPDDTSYLYGVGVYVSTIRRRQLTDEVSDETLMHDYPGLTKDDLLACLKFEAVRNRRKL